MTYSKSSTILFLILATLSLYVSNFPYDICFLVARGVYLEQYKNMPQEEMDKMDVWRQELTTEGRLNLEGYIRKVREQNYEEKLRVVELDSRTKYLALFFVKPWPYGLPSYHIPNPLGGILIIVLWSIFFILSWLLPRCVRQENGFNSISIQILAFALHGIICLVVQLILIWILTLPTIAP